MFVGRDDRFHAGEQALGERPVVEGERNAQQGRQYRRVVGVGADGVEPVELLQHRPRLLVLAQGEQDLGDGGGCEGDERW